MSDLMMAEREQIVPHTMQKVFRSHLPYMEVEMVESLDEVVDSILRGPMALLIDGETEALIIDSRIYPGRDPEEPDIERVTRGSRDGFVETMLFNITLEMCIRDRGNKEEINF